jgi:hypothetical protein
MKVRWTNETVRLRITPRELDTILDGRTVTAELAAPGGSWRVEVGPGESTGIAMVDGIVLHVWISPVDREQLADPENEGVYFSTDDECPLRYYVEKDFPCVHPRPPAAHEPVTDTFAPPNGFAERHKTTCT